MKNRNLFIADGSGQRDNALRLWSIIKQLDQILTELDAMNMHLAANHISLGTELLWKIRACPPNA